MKTTTYDGNTLYYNKELNADDQNVFLNFGLYGYEDIDFNESKINIKAEFEYIYLKQLKATLSKMGLKFVKLEYYSPKEYNFANDSLDLIISVKNKSLLKKMIIKYADKINAKLSANRSYDGYLANTVADTERELYNMKSADYSPDIIVLSVLINEFMIFEQCVINDALIFEEDEGEQ